MSYKPPRVRHGVSIVGLLFDDARYVVCAECGYVRRAWGKRPLIHKGGRPRR